MLSESRKHPRCGALDGHTVAELLGKLAGEAQRGRRRTSGGLFYLRSVPISAPKNRSTAVLFVSILRCRCLAVAPKCRAPVCSAFHDLSLVL